MPLAIVISRQACSRSAPTAWLFPVFIRLILPVYSSKPLTRGAACSWEMMGVYMARQMVLALAVQASLTELYFLSLPMDHLMNFWNSLGHPPEPIHIVSLRRMPMAIFTAQPTMGAQTEWGLCLRGRPEGN